ncbi:MAG: TetR/AcrR family transcriptional regulator, partial [Rhodobacterales bacterium]
MTRKAFQRLSEDTRRTSLLEATLACVADLGLNGASARRIAERADVSAGLLRHYFPSKDQMIRDSYAYLIGQLTGDAARAADQKDATPEAALAGFITGNVTPPNLSSLKLSLWATFIGRVRADPAFADIHRDSYREFLEILEGLIHPVLLAQGRPTDPASCQRLAIAVNGIIDGLWLEGSIEHGLYNPNGLT